MSDEELIARLRDAPADGLGTENLCLEAADRIEDLTAMLAAIDCLMVRRIKHHQEMKDLKGSGTAQKREHYKLHALSEALGEIRKVTRGESHE